MPRYVCVHGHFYQPPRENPWLEFVEIQESAAPWHDWNERIAAECYRRNTASRILNDSGDIKKICNNYSRISFNIGPTLLSWMKEKTPRCYSGILEADRLGLTRFSGHGSAIAQVYSHIIMPLANRRDKTTQVKWAICDFKSHFGRMPEGMWLAETAVDTETLEVLAENGILFTVLAPKQASEVRSLQTGDWQDVKQEKIDTSKAYRCDLPSGRNISLFFYDGSLSQSIAFGGLLNDGGFFARRLIDAVPETSNASLSHVATDGESYGHHHDHGDMALAYCLEVIESGQEATLTVYGEFLEKFPPQDAVRIVENSSWSCAHGIERWRSDCGCSGGTAGYHQKWRAPLREALDWLRDKLIDLYEREGSRYLKNPWDARDSYIDILLDRSQNTVENWLASQSLHPLTPQENVQVLKLMEMQRCAILMYTSCGWFFDEISGIETTQILRYAARAVALAYELTGLNYEIEFSRLLEKAPSNVPQLLDGRRVYDLLVKTAQFSFERLAAHYAMETVFPDFPVTGLAKRCWDVVGQTAVVILDSDMPDSRSFTAGEVKITSKVTWEEKKFLFAVNYRGDTSLVCGIAPADETTLENLREESESLRKIFAASDDKEMIARFGHNLFSLRHILGDAQRTLLEKLLQQDTVRIENSLRHIVHDYSKLFDYLSLLEINAPSIISAAASIVISSDVVHALEEEIPDIGGIRQHIERARQQNIKLDDEKIRVAVTRWLFFHMEKIHDNPYSSASMERICGLLSLFIDEFKWHLSLYEAQNFYHNTKLLYRKELSHANAELRTVFLKLGRRLKFSEEALGL